MTNTKTTTKCKRKKNRTILPEQSYKGSNKKENEKMEKMILK
jgi:hypothetical protein